MYQIGVTQMSTVVYNKIMLSGNLENNREEESEPVRKNILRAVGIPESQVVANKNPVRVSFGKR